VKSIDSASEARVRESFSLCQQKRFMHAGAIASVADSDNGYAGYTLAPADTDVLLSTIIVRPRTRGGTGTA
jgi:acyl-coenzyme A thioesterase PaaI-like protein